ncbi:MAG: SDR family oxidoreductase [Dehalococcoidia bacterium]|jgi:3-oxoacyl-[acyl-carrier protein] reductase|nr:SDR family oxidoreductase [Dehalococcoidia bacterium]MDP7201888.1 SDR family oxidoreductase [Dehalococcoidia bacterium]
MKRALVTGGTRAIGAAIAEALLEAGHEVIVTGTSADGKAPKGCSYIPSDFTDMAAVHALGRQIAGLELSVLVNNAGTRNVAYVEEFDPDGFLELQQVNVTAPFFLCRAVIPGMRERGFGRIVNLTSVFSVVSKPGRSAYSMSKLGLVGMTRTLALEVAADNVLVNCLGPGFVETEATKLILGEAGLAEMVAQVPLGRLAQPEEIARYVVFLASEANTYMTGQNMIVDGGFTCA